MSVKEDRIIDALEPILNQHRLVIDRSIIEWDRPMLTRRPKRDSFICYSTK